MSLITRLRVSLLAIGTSLLLGVVTPNAAAQDRDGVAPPIETYPVVAWPKSVVDQFSTLPVQEGGRIKPLSTYARFLLLKLNDRTSLKMPEGTQPSRRSATEWLLDCVFFPQIAARTRCFVVVDDDVLMGVGHSVEGRRKRDWYSYLELLPARDGLMRKASEYEKIDPKERRPVENQTLRVASSLIDFEFLIHALDGARFPIDVADVSPVQALFGAEKITYSMFLGNADPFLSLARAAVGGDTLLEEGFDRIYRHGDYLSTTASALHFLPPADPKENEWHSPGDLFQLALKGEDHAASIELVRQFEGLASYCNDATEEGTKGSIRDEAAFSDAVAEFCAGVVNRATARGEYKHVPLEVTFYKGKFFFFNPWIFLVGFLFAASLAMVPKLRALAVAAWSVTGIATILLCVGIVMRCIIRERPPVSTLYETILFITGVGVVVCLVAEWIDRRRIALAVAAFMGSLGMFLANKYELHEGIDTMPTLVAVLDTNFWLATHVTSVTIGYAAGLFAAALAHVHLATVMFNRGKANDVARSLARMVYGVLCFGVVFATVGTILGGVWANDSWGRFWGWDPKENGALMIVLADLIILHCRMGGYLKPVGISVATILAGGIVVFSWWGVNLLGVGLHSYGFTSGAALGMTWFAIIETGFLAICAVYGIVYSIRSKGQSSPTAS